MCDHSLNALIMAIFEELEDKFSYPLIFPDDAREFVNILISKGYSCDLLEKELKENQEIILKWLNGETSYEFEEKLLKRINKPFKQTMLFDSENEEDIINTEIKIDKTKVIKTNELGKRECSKILSDLVPSNSNIETLKGPKNSPITNKREADLSTTYKTREIEINFNSSSNKDILDMKPKLLINSDEKISSNITPSSKQILLKTFHINSTDKLSLAKKNTNSIDNNCKDLKDNELLKFPSDHKQTILPNNSHPNSANDLLTNVTRLNNSKTMQTAPKELINVVNKLKLDKDSNSISINDKTIEKIDEATERPPSPLTESPYYMPTILSFTLEELEQSVDSEHENENMNCKIKYNNSNNDGENPTFLTNNEEAIKIETSNLNISTLKKEGTGYLYVFSDIPSGSIPKIKSTKFRVRVSVSRDPIKCLKIATAFNPDIKMLSNISVAERIRVLNEIRIKLKKFAVKNKLDWYYITLSNLYSAVESVIPLKN